MLYFCSWPDIQSWVVEAEDEAEAKKRGAAITGKPPAKVEPLPGPIAFEVERMIVDGDDGEDEDHDVEIFPDAETVAILWALDLATSPTEAAGPQCSSTADDDDDEEVRCELLEGHDGDHAGEGLVWS